MTSMLTFRPVTKPPAGPSRSSRILVIGIIAIAGLMLLGLLAVPMLVGTDLFFAASAGCSGQQSGIVGQPAPASGAKGIPSNYLFWYRKVGQQYGVPWTILAGIGTVESDNGQTTLPGVHSNSNAFGAAGPMQIGIGGAAGNTWGGAPIHPASEVVDGVATDEDGDGVANVYDPADAIAGAAKYLLAAGVTTNPSAAIFSYNHLQSYVETVEYYAGVYAGGKFNVVSASIPAANSAAGCAGTAGVPTSINAPNTAVATAIAFAEEQLGKPYEFGATGPDAFDCSGLVMMAYRSAGIDIPRTAGDQYKWGPQVPADQVEPGDLVFFVGADGTKAAPGHVGLVIGNGQMIDAPEAGIPIHIVSYSGMDPVGFTRPWAHAGVNLQAAAQSSG